MEAEYLQSYIKYSWRIFDLQCVTAIHVIMHEYDRLTIDKTGSGCINIQFMPVIQQFLNLPDCVQIKISS